MSIRPQVHVPGTIQYANVPRVIAILVSNKMATLYELQTVYGLSDAYDLLEILVVDRYNESRAIEWRSQKN